MTLEQFIQQASEECRKYIKDDRYISALRPDMEKYYGECQRISKILGSEQLSASGYAYGASMLYPDMPPAYN